MSRERFDTVVPNAKRKLNFLVQNCFAGTPPTLEDIAEQRPSFCGVGPSSFWDGPTLWRGKVPDRFPPGFPFAPSPPECPPGQIKLTGFGGGICVDRTKPTPIPKPPQDPSPPPPKPLPAPLPPDPAPTDSCSNFANTNNCVAVYTQGYMSVNMSSLDILTNYEALGGVDSEGAAQDDMLDLMMSTCGDVHPSSISSDNNCLYSDPPYNSQPIIYTLQVTSSTVGTCADRKSADDSAIEKYLENGGYVNNTEIEYVSVETGVLSQQNCLEPDVSVNRTPDFEDDETRVSIPAGFYQTYDGGRFSNSTSKYLRFGWIAPDSYDLASPGFKTMIAPGQTLSPRFLTNLKLGRCITGFETKGDYIGDDRLRGNDYGRVYLEPMRRFNQYGTYYHSGSPIEDFPPYSGYISEGLGTEWSHLKVNWVPFNRYENRQRNLTQTNHTNNFPSTIKYDTSPAIKGDWPNLVTIYHQGTLIVRTKTYMDANKTFEVARHRSGMIYNNFDLKTKLYATTSPTKKRFVNENIEIPFSFNWSYYATVGGRRYRSPSTMMSFNYSFFTPIAIKDYETWIKVHSWTDAGYESS